MDNKYNIVLFASIPMLIVKIQKISKIFWMIGKNRTFSCPLL